MHLRELGYKYIFIAAVPKILGAWTNEGTCQAAGQDPACGPGTQNQVRTCTDGTLDKCTDDEKQRGVTCLAAGTELPSCHIRNINFNSIWNFHIF